MRNSKVSLNKINLFLRDQFTCQYCLLIGDKNSLTVDHVIPRSIGGKTTWDNVTTACYHCNQKKAWRSPKEAGMILNRQPKEPSWNNLVATRMKRHSKEKWKKYYE